MILTKLGQHVNEMKEVAVKSLMIKCSYIQTKYYYVIATEHSHHVPCSRLTRVNDVAPPHLLSMTPLKTKLESPREGRLIVS